MIINKIDRTQNFGMPWDKETYATDKEFLVKRLFNEQASIDEADRTLNAIKWLAHPENTPYHKVSLLHSPYQKDTIWIQGISTTDNYDDVSQILKKPHGTPKRTADVLDEFSKKIANSCIKHDGNIIGDVEAQESFLENLLKHLRKEK